MVMETPENLAEQMSSADLTSEPDSNHENIECHHGMDAKVYTSWTWRNPGRRFYRCAIWQLDDCGYFKWYDPWINQYNKELMYTSVQERKILKQQVQLMKEKENILCHKLSNADEIIDNLKEDNEKLNRRIERLTVIKGELQSQKKKLKIEKSRLKVINVVLIVALAIVAISCQLYWNGRKHGVAYKMLS